MKLGKIWYKELKTYLFWRCAMAELLASTLYCFFATTMLYRLQNSYDRTLQTKITMTSLVLGFLTIALSHAFGITHNAFIFPAVTLGKCLMKKNSFLKCLFYFVFQMAGGIIGVSLNLALRHDLSLQNGSVTPVNTLIPALKTSPGKGCLLEGLLSFVLVLVVLSSYGGEIENERESNNRRNEGTPTLIFGFAVAASFIISYPETGGMLNPSIVLGIGVVHNHWPDHIWIYWAGPLVGGIIAGIVNLLFLLPPKESELCNAHEEECSPLYSADKSSRPTRLDHLDRNGVLSYSIETNPSSAYRNPVFDGDADVKNSKL